jgi:PAS domain S-box-containing protein
MAEGLPRVPPQKAERRTQKKPSRREADQLDSLSRAMASFVETRSWHQASHHLLIHLMSVTGARHGCIGVVLLSGKLHILASEGFSEGLVLQELSGEGKDQSASGDNVSLSSLFLQATQTRKPIFSHNTRSAIGKGVLTDEDIAGEVAVLGLPILRGADPVGMVALSLPEHSFTARHIHALELPLQFAALLYDGYRSEERERMLHAERAISERQARHAEQRFRDIYEASTDAIAYTALDGRLLDVNVAFERLTGYSKDELLRMTYQDLTPEEFLTHELELVKELLRTGTQSDYEKEYIRKDGSRVPIALTPFVVRNMQNEPTGVAAIIKNIARRKHNEQELYQRERQLRALLEEREQLSEDLHDGIMQTLYGIGLTLQQSQYCVRRQPKMAEEHLQGAIERLNGAMRTIRRYIAGGPPDIATGDEMKAALESWLASMAEISEVRFLRRLHITAIRRLSPKQAQHIFFIVKEAVTNAVRHARARHVSVSLTMCEGDVHLRVMDDGIGFEPSQIGGGYGLHNMKTRAHKIDGKIHIGTKDPAGTRVDVYVPEAVEKLGSEHGE